MQSATSASNPLHASWLGRVGYVEGWRLQEAVATRVRGGADARLLLLEHDPVYTIGRSGSVDNLLASAHELRAAGAAVYRVDRGGDITYHGPGQLVGYPIVGLGPGHDLVAYVRALESGLIDAVARYGVAARAEIGKTGIWVDLPDGSPAKLAAIGVRVSRAVSTHGFALNVSTNLRAFDRMIPCGFAHRVASLHALGVTLDLETVAADVARALGERFGRPVAWDGPPAPALDDEIGERAPVRGANDLVATLAAAC